MIEKQKPSECYTKQCFKLDSEEVEQKDGDITDLVEQPDKPSFKPVPKAKIPLLVVYISLMFRIRRISIPSTNYFDVGLIKILL